MRMESQETIPHSNYRGNDAQPHGILLAQWAADKKATNVRLYDVRKGCSYADYVLIASGNSDRHVVAIAENLKEASKKAGHIPLGTEGFQEGHWALIDFGDVVAHVFYEPVRAYYELDRLWGEEATEIVVPGLATTSEPSYLDDNDDDDE